MLFRRPYFLTFWPYLGSVSMCWIISPVSRPRFCRYVEKIADHRRNLGRVGKMETLPICPRPSQIICIYMIYLQNPNPKQQVSVQNSCKVRNVNNSANKNNDNESNLGKEIIIWDVYDFAFS